MHQTVDCVALNGGTLRVLILLSSDRSFDELVWHAVSLIPHGHVATYGQVAEWIGGLGCARQVGWSLRRLTLPTEVPWQRVVNAKGRISMSLSREGSDWMQRELLIAEAIPVDAEGRLPLKRFLWMPDLEALALEINQFAIARE